MSDVDIQSHMQTALPQMEEIFSQVGLVPFAELMVAEAKRVPPSPYETGHNRDTIRMDPPNPGPNEMIVRIITESGYGGWLEIGTSRRPATPYIAPAFQAAKAAFGV